MHPPDFWYHPQKNFLAHLLSPFGGLYHLAVQKIYRYKARYRSALPVICVGNLVMGGAGKTPVALAIARLLQAQGKRPAFLTRGYGGRCRKVLKVNEQDHDAGYVGDEALLLARCSDTWVAADRVAGALAIEQSGADLIIMDDGFQNPSLAKDLSLIVIDGAVGFGNHAVFPAGPLREYIFHGLKRADGVVVIGHDRCNIIPALPKNLPVIKAEIKPTLPQNLLKTKPLHAFAGIGRPDKFFQLLKTMGFSLLRTRAFSDHFFYSPAVVYSLKQAAREDGALLVTTEKDYVRLPASLREDITVLPVHIAWKHETEINGFVSRVLSQKQVAQE